MTSGSVWLLTISVLVGVLLLDLLLAIKRRNQETTTKEAGLWTIFYVAAAIIFGWTLGSWENPQARSEFFAGWLTEYSLSIDNVFVFIIILARLKISKERAQLVLLIGIILALVLRGAFIAAGAALIHRFVAIFFLFGAFLLYTAWHLAKDEDESNDWQESKLIKTLAARGATPFTIALVAVGTTDLLFALDSIPAIFGLTKDPYIVFTANAFALMGLRQLYFLLGDFLNRLIYLSKGLAIILGFIGVKLIIEALHGVGIHKIGAFKIPEVSLAVSLGVIVASLAVTTLISLTRSSSKPAEKD
ncbi:MAG: TerC family protein [Actinobacteria bacterium]|nr:TerC family protein [Actinomycetota bacterium]